MTKLFEAKPFIIAEIGSNWTNFQEAKDAISFAKQAGADAVKFQLFDSQSLYGFPHIDIQGVYCDDGKYVSMPIDWLPKLKEKAVACGIEFMCSAFSPELYDVIDPYVSVHKIASSELTYPQLLKKVKSKGKPILLSVGASSKGDIEQAMQILRGGPQVVLLYCSAAYPSSQFNLFYMQDLKDTFHVPVGLSDHSLDVYYTGLSAYHHFGAVVIEKHVNFTDHVTPDSPHSLNHKDFVLMCDVLHGKRDYKTFNPMPEEQEMFLKHNRRVIALKDINVGDSFKYGHNYGAYRSLKDDSHGLTPFAWEALEKSPGAKKAIKAGDGVGPGDF
jgi:sialic acid synthase SpsE